MQPPRWFYPMITACAILLTLSLSGALISLTYRLRYTTDPEHGALIDHWRRSYCLTGGCVSFDDTTGVEGGSPSAASPDSVGVPMQPPKPLTLDSMMQPRRDSR